MEGSEQVKAPAFDLQGGSLQWLTHGFETLTMLSIGIQYHNSKEITKIAKGIICPFNEVFH